MNAPDIHLPDSPDTASFHSSWFLKAVHFNVKREVDISMHLSGGDIFSADVRLQSRSFRELDSV